jgi:hypothetical protein
MGIGARAPHRILKIFRGLLFSALLLGNVDVKSGSENGRRESD